jgi:transcriptional regulator with GAF, ATPase, and Fis domain
MSSHYTDLLLEAGDLITKADTKDDIFEILIEYVNSALHPDLSCFYANNNSNTKMSLIIKRGFPEIPVIKYNNSELMSFLKESQELVCLNSRKQSPFEELLLTDQMNSALAIPVIVKKIDFGVLIINSVRPFFFKREDILFLENLSSIIIGK